MCISFVEGANRWRQKARGSNAGWLVLKKGAPDQMFIYVTSMKVRVNNNQGIYIAIAILQVLKMKLYMFQKTSLIYLILRKE